ncbi:MAG: GH3 auxin-responsive promoter family protein [Saprospiraceae bacterium]|nr:GH3 auxin-responsive promoter family protein [Saprospiraceae bacterium]
MPIFGNLIKRGLSLGDTIGSRKVDVSPQHFQLITLQRLLRKAQFTTFGKYYGFQDILRSPRVIEAYQDRVPIYTYDQMYNRWWHMSLRQLDNVSWPDRVKYFALSSGTSGAPSKYLPVTDDLQKSMRRAGLKMFFAFSKFNVDPSLFTRSMMMLGGSSDLQNGSGFYAGDLSGINANKLPLWLRPFYKPGAEIAQLSDWDSRLDMIARKAKEWDIGFIVGIPSWLQLMLKRIIEHHGVDNIHEIWPNLQVCVHGGVAFEPYRKSMDQFLGKPLIYLDTYLASEGFIAFQSRPDTLAMKLQLHNGLFFEFVPYNDQNFDQEGNLLGQPKALTIEDVSPGEHYALLLSSNAGAWRYMIGDTVQFSDPKRSEIIITGRTKHFLSVCGEHVSVDNMNQVVQYLEERFDVNIPEFTVSAIQSGPHHAHRWYIGMDPALAADKIVSELDRHLCAINDDYRTERDHVLQQPEVIILPSAMFYDFQRHKGQLGGQYKFPRVMRGAAFAEWEQFVHSHRPVSQMH